MFVASLQRDAVVRLRSCSSSVSKVAQTTTGDIGVDTSAIFTTPAAGSTAFPAYPASSPATASTAAKSAVPASTASSRGSTKGAEIRAKIAANRAKRLKIADAMKKEAGVTDHTVNHEDLGGLAYIGTARIYSPEGRKIVQLYTLAHECGHIFLHNSGPGYTLPGHVKEFEAESYAHQAFREHGMTVPQRRSNWGRDYVASWIEKDRAANIAIDPRAMEYAAGRRSPYEPLRMVPATWQIFHAAAAPAAPTTIAARQPWADWLRTVANDIIDEALPLFRLAASCTLLGTIACLIGLLIVHDLQPLPNVFPRLPEDVTWAEILTAFAGGLWLANFAVLWRTTTR